VPFRYEIQPITDEPMLESKDPRQVFYGLNPGWLINLADREIYKPMDKDLNSYYSSGGSTNS
jgi:large subunit ribosomal protein L15